MPMSGTDLGASIRPRWSTAGSTRYGWGATSTSSTNWSRRATCVTARAAPWSATANGLRDDLRHYLRVLHKPVITVDDRPSQAIGSGSA